MVSHGGELGCFTWLWLAWRGSADRSKDRTGIDQYIWLGMGVEGK